jgi:hypothetical protein
VFLPFNVTPDVLLQIGQVHMAADVYRRILAAPLTDADVRPVPSEIHAAVARARADSATQGNAGTIVCMDLRREAAWNLSCILRQSGQHALAQQLCNQHLCVDEDEDAERASGHGLRKPNGADV